VFIKPAEGISRNVDEVDLRAQDVANVRDTKFEHGLALQPKTPGDNANIRWQSKRFEHLGPEHTRVADLHPSVEAGMVAKNFHGWLGVGVVGRFPANFLDAHLLEKNVHEADEVTKREVAVSNDALDLVELCEMGGIDAFVPEDAID